MTTLYIHGDPISKLVNTGRCWGLGLQHTFFFFFGRGHNSIHNRRVRCQDLKLQGFLQHILRPCTGRLANRDADKAGVSFKHIFLGGKGWYPLAPLLLPVPSQRADLYRPHPLGPSPQEPGGLGRERPWHIPASSLPTGPLPSPFGRPITAALYVSPAIPAPCSTVQTLVSSRFIPLPSAALRAATCSRQAPLDPAGLHQ